MMKNGVACEECPSEGNGDAGAKLQQAFSEKVAYRLDSMRL